jgi:hypothetical protein
MSSPHQRNQQLSADGGRSAMLGSFKRCTEALGAMMSYGFKCGDVPLATHVRYYREFYTKDRG